MEIYAFIVCLISDFFIVLNSDVLTPGRKASAQGLTQSITLVQVGRMRRFKNRRSVVLSANAEATKRPHPRDS